MASVLKVDTVLESTPGAGTNFGGVGSASVPTLSIGSQTNKGFYDAGSNKIGVSVGGSKVGEIGVDYGGFTGNVVQVQSTTKTDTWSQSSVNTNTFYDVTGLSVNITPKYSNSKILVFGNVNVIQSTTATILMRIYRNSVIIGGSTTNGANQLSISNLFRPMPTPYDIDMGNLNFNFYDTPNSTSLLNYKIALSLGVTYSGTVYVNRTVSDGNTDFASRTTSTISVMEVQQ